MRAPEQAAEADDAFEEFARIYPNPEGMAAARRTFLDLIRTGKATAGEMIQGAKNARSLAAMGGSGRGPRKVRFWFEDKGWKDPAPRAENFVVRREPGYQYHPDGSFSRWGI